MAESKSLDENSWAHLLRKELGFDTLSELSDHLGFDVTDSSYTAQAQILMRLERVRGEGPTSDPRKGWMVG